MGRAATLDEIERAALSGLLDLTDPDIVAYMGRRHDGVWTIGAQAGLIGNVAGVAVPEDLVPYADDLRAGRTLCYENPAAMGADVAAAMGAVGLSSLYGVPMMQDGTCVGALAVGRRHASTFDVRHRALAELFASQVSALAAKRQLAQSLGTLAQSVPVIVLRTEPNGWITWYNRRWYEFTGQTYEEAEGWGWQTAHHPEDFLRVMEEWPKALATGKRIEIEFRLRRYDGAYHWHLAIVDPVRDDKGEIVSWYGSIVDIEAQKQALERTKRVADVLQEAFLPPRLPQRENLRLDAHYVSAERDALVGGDWYDGFELPDGRLILSIGDVAGHGLEASITVGRLRQSIFTLARLIDDPAKILAEVNRIALAQENGAFVTVLVAVVDAAGGMFSYASAGHPAPVIARRSHARAQTLPAGGPPIGVLPELALDVHQARIDEHCVIALYTDGLIEYARDVLTGEARLEAVLPSLVGEMSLEHPAKFVYDETIGDHVSQDDTAVLLLQFSPVDPHARDSRPSMGKQWRFHASDAKAAHVARREVGAFLHRKCGDGEGTFQSELVVGELLANTVEHAPGLVHLVLEWTGGQYVLIVRDSGPGLETVAAALPDHWEEGSRGLFLVTALSPSVTVAKSPSGGAELRVVLPLQPL